MSENKGKIIAAIITAIATVFAAMLTGVGEQVVDYLLPPQATATVIAPPAPIATDVITPTTVVLLTPVADSTPWELPVEAPGEDWLHSCISADSWRFFSQNPIGEIQIVDGCYQLIEYGISAHQGNLVFVRNKVRIPETHGILIPIPNDAEISFHLRTTELTNAEIWTGIVRSQDSQAGKYLVAKDGGYFDIVEIKEEFPSVLHRNYEVKYNQGDYKINFDIEGNQWSIGYNGFPAPMFSHLILDFSPRYLFIGYRAYPEGNVAGKIEVRISELQISEH